MRALAMITGLFYSGFGVLFIRLGWYFLTEALTK